MRFVRDGKPAEDNFQRVADDVPIPENVPVLLSATRFLAEASADGGRPEPLGVLWPNNKDVEELAPASRPSGGGGAQFPELPRRPRL